MTLKDYSNYHNTNINEKISHDGLFLLENSLNGFESYDVTINDDLQSKLLVYQKWDSESETKKVIGRIEDIERGNLYKIDDLHWLVTSFPEDNKIYRKAEIRLCNSTFPIEQDKISILMTDSEGKPIYDRYGDEAFEWVGGGFIETPCVVETTYFNKDNNTQLPLPDNSIKIIIKYAESSSLKENYEFEMYSQKYKITFIDYSKVLNGVGIITIQAKRMV